MILKAVALMLLTVMGGQTCDIDLGKIDLDELVVTHRITATNLSARDVLIEIAGPDITRHAVAGPGAQVKATSFAGGRVWVIARPGDDLVLARQQRRDRLLRLLGAVSLSDAERAQIHADLKELDALIQQSQPLFSGSAFCLMQLEARDDGKGATVNASVTLVGTEWMISVQGATCGEGSINTK